MQPTQTVAIITSLLSLFVLLTACGGSNGTPADPDDVTAPTVTSTSPASGATKVLTSSSVTATFNEAMDSSTLTTSTFTLDEASPVAGSVSYDDGTLTATFASTNSLKPGTLHTATLDTTVADSAGNSLAAVNVWSFTTENFIYRVSVDSSGIEANGDNNGVTISPDGRYVGFYSEATNLVANDTNGWSDTFIYDTQSGTIILVSVASDGTQGDMASDDAPAISAGGQYVGFYSAASNLVSGDTNGVDDVFVRDTVNNTTTRVSVPNLADQGFLGAEGDGSSATQKLSISSDGRYLAFASGSTNLVIGDTNAQRDIFVHDTQTGSTIRVNMDSAGTESDGDSHSAFISADGRYVAFISDATNLVAGDTNAVGDIFRALNTTP